MLKDYIIIANGDFLAKEMILRLCKNKTIIALDGAADKLLALHIKPDILLGDFDSIQAPMDWGIHPRSENLTEKVIPYLGAHDVVIIPRNNQQMTDLVKAILYCDHHCANSITVICALGGRLDHHENNLRTLRAQYKRERPILLYTDMQTIRFVKDETIDFSGKIGDKCGIMAYPQGSFTSQGLMYEVTNFALEFGKTESVGNVLAANDVKVKVEGEALLIMPGMIE